MSAHESSGAGAGAPRVANAEIAEHGAFAAGYRLLALRAPAVAAAARPGQFVHLRVPHYEQAVLRRPFSIYRADPSGELGILYKAVGGGTRALAEVPAGAAVSLIGPLGNGFPAPAPDARPVLVAGGYGVAPLCFLARRSPAPGLAFVGGRTAADILCVDELRALGWEVRIATEDGSAGARGRVTDALDAWAAAEGGGRAPELFACGPDGMLRAVGERASARGWTAWLSLDKHMGCGVGACLACVQKIRMPDGTAHWLRVCREGPVFEARKVVWE